MFLDSFGRALAPRETVTYQITCPRDLTPDATLALMRSLGGLLRPGSPANSAALEVVADHRGLFFQVTFPPHMADAGQRLITTHLIGAALTVVDPADDPLLATTWTRAIEVGLSSNRIPLRIPSPVAAVAGLLAAFTGLAVGEALAQQWIITGARPLVPPRKRDEATSWWHRPPDPAVERRKVEEAPLHAVGRLAAKGPAPDQLLACLHGPYASLSAHGVQVRRRLVSSPVVLRRLQQRAGATRPSTLTAAELAVVSALPIGRPNVPGLPVARARRLPADHTIPRAGLLVAISNYPGDERPIALAPEDLLKHTVVHGKTGVGKSALMLNLAAAQIEAGYGVGLIDPTGDTAADLLERIPPHRSGDVVVFDPTDTEYPVGLNIFAGHDNPEVLADQLMAIFHGIYRDQGIYTSNYLRAAIQTLAAVPGQTLVEVPPFLTDPVFRRRIVRQVADPMLTSIWQRFDAEKPATQMQLVAPALHRVQPLLLRRSVRLTLGQAANRLDASRVLRERKILIASLPKGLLGEETSALFGSLLFARLWQAAMGRPRGQRWPYFLHVDEAQNFLNMPLAISDVLAEARKYGLGLTLAHQHGGQLPAQLRTAIAANTRTKIAFAVSAEDASSVAREVGPPVEPADLVALGQYEIVLQTTSDNRTSAPATARTLPPAPPCSDPQAIRAGSRKRWATHRDEVEAAIHARQQAGPSPTSRGWEGS